MLNRTPAIRILWITALITPLSSCQPLQTPEQASADAVTSRAATQPYPVTATVTQVDTYHGTQVADPYRWLEDDVRENLEVRAWADVQQAVSRS